MTYNKTINRWRILPFVLVLVLTGIIRTAFAKPIDYEPTNVKNPVADNITRLYVHKLEKGSTDYVAGAKLAIIDAETGRFIYEWTTKSGDDAVQVIARNEEGQTEGLNIDTTYILRELEAPEGYSKAEDTYFVLRSDEHFNTTGEIKKGEDAEFGSISGAGDVQGFVIKLFDEATVTVDEVEQRQRTNSAEREETTTNNRSSTRNNQTSTQTQRRSGDSNENVVEEVTEDEVSERTDRLNTDNETRTVTTTRGNEVEDEVVVDDQMRQNVQDTGQNQVNWRDSSDIPQTAQSAGGAPYQRGGGTLTQTSDHTTFAPVFLVAAIGGVVIGAAVYLRQRG